MQDTNTLNYEANDCNMSANSNNQEKWSNDDLSTKLMSFENGSENIDNQNCANSDVLFGMNNTPAKKSQSLIGLTISFISMTIGSGW